MKKFNYTKYRDLKINNDILQLIIAINRYNGKHNLFAFQKPMLLKKNLKITRIQSIESSNKIEGIITTTKRLKELVERKSQPRNRNEEEIDGYRKVLDLVISS
jgi:Fic family protein